MLSVFTCIGAVVDTPIISFENEKRMISFLLVIRNTLTDKPTFIWCRDWADNHDKVYSLLKRGDLISIFGCLCSAEKTKEDGKCVISNYIQLKEIMPITKNYNVVGNLDLEEFVKLYNPKEIDRRRNIYGKKKNKLEI